MDDSPWQRVVYIGMAAVAGAITALSLMDRARMTRWDMVLTVFVGTSFALFAVPYLTADVLHLERSTLSAACGLTYLGGTFGNALIPPLLRKLKKKFALTEEVSE